MSSYILKKTLSFDLILAFILIALSVILNQILLDKVEFLQRWNNLFYDIELTSIKRPVNDDIVIIAIDGISLQRIGRWPWPRTTHATLIDLLTEAGVAAIGLDILFMEADQLNPEQDLQLGAAISRNSHVILPVLTELTGQTYRIAKPLIEIAEHAHLSHVNLHFDPQGVVRKLDLEIELDTGESLPSMPLALSRQLKGARKILNQDLKENILISFSNSLDQFKKISYVDALLKPDIRQNLKDKVVLIGLTAGGISNHFSTPISTNHRLMSGVEFQANALATILSKKIIHPLSITSYTMVSLVLIALPVLMFQFFKPSVALLLAFIFSALTCLGSFLMLNTLQLWFAPLPTLLCLILSYPLWSWHRIEKLGQSLFAEHEKSCATLNAIAEAIITTDNQGCIDYLNPAAEKMFQCNFSDSTQRYFSEICQVLEQKESTLADGLAIASEEHQAETCIIRNRQGKEYAVRMSTNIIHTKKGVQAGIVYAVSDITEVININKKIVHIATHDELTDLPNRVLLQDRIEQAIYNSKREGLSFAILFLDLDGFKKINDALGHACGDLLLQQVAQRLHNCIRKSDSISRWGGDEFILLLVNTTSSNIAATIARKIIHCLSQSFMIKDQEIFITSSIGISLFPDDGQEADKILARADKAMYNVKKNGYNNYCFYSKNLENQAKEKLLMETDLHQALESNQFEMYYQPQIDLISHKLIGFEALIRWQHPKKGLIMPDNFIPLAEELGLIISIDEWVIDAVCKFLQYRQEKKLPFIKIAINVSTQKFSQNNIVRVITEKIKQYHIAESSLQVEITESMMIQDIDLVKQILNELKNAGILIAIDDFGTGYSSLQYLKRLPIDELKIDRSFIASVLDNPDDASIVKAVIALGHNMKMRIIAEGVETREQMLFLQQHQCDIGQGYFFSKPVQASQVEQIVNKFQ